MALHVPRTDSVLVNSCCGFVLLSGTCPQEPLSCLSVCGHLEVSIFLVEGFCQQVYLLYYYWLISQSCTKFFNKSLPLAEQYQNAEKGIFNFFIPIRDETSRREEVVQWFCGESYLAWERFLQNINKCVVLCFCIGGMIFSGLHFPFMVAEFIVEIFFPWVLEVKTKYLKIPESEAD